MTSEAKRAANRKNAKKSTGPRTAAGKMRARRNALRHGLAALVLRDPAMIAEVERLAAEICSVDGNAFEREQALIVAEAQTTLKHIRRARRKIIERLSHLPPIKPRAMGEAVSAWVAEPNAPSLNQLLRLERYERQAFSRRRRTLRLGLFRGSKEIG